MLIFMLQFYVTVSTGNTVSKHKKGEKCKIFLALWVPSDPPTVFVTNQTCSPTPHFVQILPICNILPIIVQILFTSGIGPHVLLKVFEDFTTFLIWAACDLFNFYLMQKQIFSKKKAVRKLSGIKFNYIYRLHLILVIRIYFDKSLLYPEIEAARTLIK